MPCRVVLLLSGRGARAAAHLQLTWHLVKKFSSAFDLLVWLPGLAWPGRTRTWPKRKLLKVCTKVVDFIAESRVPTVEHRESWQLRAELNSFRKSTQVVDVNRRAGRDNRPTELGGQRGGAHLIESSCGGANANAGEALGSEGKCFDILLILLFCSTFLPCPLPSATSSLKIT